MRFSLIAIMCLFLCSSLLNAGQVRIRVVEIHDPITPVVAQFLHRNLEETARQGDRLLLIEMDTPGGLDSAMREIVKDIFASPVPVAVYVAPSGARAASAGAVITLAADISAMAPGTNIGAAHPVSIGEKAGKTMEEKVVNDSEAYVEGIAKKRGRNELLAQRMVRESISLSAEKAMEGRIIDMIARDRSDLLRKIDGHPFSRDGKEIILHLADAEVVPMKMHEIERVLNAISNPNVAYVLMMLGMMGLFFELSNPGVILPGVIGGISIILALFAFQTLPVNYAGLLLILLAMILFIAEIKVVSHGILTVGGVIAMVLGSLLLFEATEPYLRVSWNLIAVTIITVIGFFIFVVTKVLRVHHQSPLTGREGLIGQMGLTDSEIITYGKVFINGEYWEARSDEPIAAGVKVKVEAVEGMLLKVKK